MGRVVLDISTSLDGFVAGPNPSLEEPLGENGMRLHEWVVVLASWRESHGLSGGEEDADSEIVAEGLASTGAVVMGRRMFSGGAGPWQDDPNGNGWWGEEPPFRNPVFVLTHHEREPLTLGRRRSPSSPPAWRPPSSKPGLRPATETSSSPAVRTWPSRC